MFVAVSPLTTLPFFFWLPCLSLLRGELQGQQQPEPYEVPIVAWRDVVAVSHTAADGVAVPRAATQNTARPGRRPLWIIQRANFIIIRSVPIVAPFPNIAAHIVNTERICFCC